MSIESGPVFPISKQESTKQKEEYKDLPDFLLEKNGRVFSAAEGDADVTEEYEAWLEKIHKKPDFPPPFLYEDSEGRIHIANDAVVDVTDELKDWLKILKSKE